MTKPDIVERLRRYNPVTEQLEGLPHEQEAADLIERYETFVGEALELCHNAVNPSDLENAIDQIIEKAEAILPSENSGE
jgi:thymidine phosphorylase